MKPVCFLTFSHTLQSRDSSASEMCSLSFFFNDLVFVQFLIAVKGNKSFETVYKKPSVVSPPG